MALVYAFIDDGEVYHGEPTDRRPTHEFDYVPSSGPFAGQQLRMHAASWDGTVSDRQIPMTDTWRFHATEQVAAALWPDAPAEHPPGHRPGT